MTSNLNNQYREGQGYIYLHVVYNRPSAAPSGKMLFTSKITDFSCAKADMPA